MNNETNSEFNDSQFLDFLNQDIGFDDEVLLLQKAYFGLEDSDLCILDDPGFSMFPMQLGDQNLE